MDLVKPRPRLTRKRLPLSCIACRSRKLKCNRERPCQNCLVRGEDATSCVYAQGAEGKLAAKSKARSDSEDMRKRINRIEDSILSMIASGTNPVQIDKGSIRPTEVAEDKPRLAGGQIMSLDTKSTHWDAVLHDLEAMKDAYDEDSQDEESVEVFNNTPASVPKAYRPSLLTALSTPPDRSTVLASLPSKSSADILIARFFGYYNPAAPAKYLVHKATFLKQYEKHFQDPSSTKITWVGLLFGMLCIALQSYHLAREEAPGYQGTSAAITDLYRIRAAQCLVIADITKPVKFMLEALMIYSMAEYSDESDGDMGCWLLSGNMMRLALQQGYHRDPSHFPGISTFDGEMRRRVWTSLSQHELLFSVKIGLPKAIRFAECDVALPRHIHNDELYEEMTELPASRPMTELTYMSYFITKALVLRAYGKVVEYLAIIEPQPYTELLRIDQILLQTRSLIPSYLEVRSLEEMRDYPSSRIMESFFLQLFYHKAVCILHRKYWDVALENSTNLFTPFYSRKTCVDSSIALLNHQASMHRLCQPGMPLAGMKWYDFAITNHDFVLAAMVICLDLMSTFQAGPPSGYEGSLDEEMEKYELIKRSRGIWAEIVLDCRDATRARNVLDGVIRKLSTKIAERRSLYEMQMKLLTKPTADVLQYDPYFTDQFGLGPQLANGSGNGMDTVMQDELFSKGGIIDSLGSENAVGDFNWDTWDNLLLTPQNGQPFVAGF